MKRSEMETENTATEETATPEERENLPSILARAWGVFTSCPTLLIPPAAVGSGYVLMYSLLFFHFSSGLAAKVESLHIKPAELDSKAVQALSTLVSKEMIFLIALVVIIRAFIGVFHHAGWSRMFAVAALRGRATIADYLHGIKLLGRRFLTGVIVKLCIHAIPALIILVAAAAVFTVRKGSGEMAAFFTSASTIMFSIPLILVVEAIISVALYAWKPACAFHDITAPDSISIAFSFFRNNLGDTLLYFVTRAIFNLFLFISLAAVFTLLLKSSFDGSGGAAIGARIPAMLGAAAATWFAGMLGMIYFTLAYYVLYASRVPRHEEEELKELHVEPLAEN